MFVIEGNTQNVPEKRCLLIKKQSVTGESGLNGPFVSMGAVIINELNSMVRWQVLK